MRAYKKNHTIDDPSIKAETHFDDAIDQQKPTYSFTLSTEMCMIIHGAILASLFIVAISR